MYSSIYGFDFETKLTPTLIFVFLVFSIPLANASSNYTELVYKNCTNPSASLTTDSIRLHSQAVSSFFEELKTQSSKSKFFRTVAGVEDSAVSGLFQCRGDLSNNECHNCIKALPEQSNILCRHAIRARIQLQGCYFWYKTEMLDTHAQEEEAEVPKHELFHKICHDEGAAEFGLEFEEMKATAFADAVEGIAVAKEGFYTENYRTVHVEAQCQGELEGCECAECVSAAVGVMEEQCWRSMSGQVYLEGCFLGYSYHHPRRIPGYSHHHEKDDVGNTGKTLAIVMGGAAALAFAFIFIIFLKNVKKKDDF